MTNNTMRAALTNALPAPKRREFMLSVMALLIAPKGEHIGATMGLRRASYDHEEVLRHQQAACEFRVCIYKDCHNPAQLTAGHGWTCEHHDPVALAVTQAAQLKHSSKPRHQWRKKLQAAAQS